MMKRNKIPYREILHFCYTRNIDTNTLLLDEPVEIEGKVTIKYFKSLEDYALYLESQRLKQQINEVILEKNIPENA